MKKMNRKGFTLAELLIVAAIIAVLVAIAIPVFTSQLEKSRESTDLANVRSKYAEVMALAVMEDEPSAESGIIRTDNGGVYTYSATVELKQKQDNWQMSLPISIGGVESESDPDGTAPDAAHWVGKPGDTCTITYSDADGVTFEWNGNASGNAVPSFASMATSFVTNKRWLKRNGQLIYGDRNLAEGEITLNEEPYSVPKGTTVTFTPTSTMKYSYYLINADGSFVDSGWITTASKSSQKQFTVDADGCKLLVVAKLINEDGTRRNATTFTDEEKRGTLNGVSVVLP